MIDATRSLPSHLAYGTGFGPSTLDMQRGWDEYVPAGTDAKDPRISPLFATELATDLASDLPPALVC